MRIQSVNSLKDALKGKTDSMILSYSLTNIQDSFKICYKGVDENVSPIPRCMV